MAILDYPTAGVFSGAELDWGLIYNTWSFTSPISRAVQTVGMPGARWRARLSWSPNGIPADMAAEIEAFLLTLEGRGNRLRFWNLAKRVPRGQPQGAPVVFGAAQVGSTVSTQGWTANRAGLLLPGDMVGIGGELKMVTAPVASDAQGRAVIAFKPELRASPANGSAIVTDRPTALFISDQDEVSWTSLRGRIDRGLELNLTEVFA